jgi:LacI family transcriptional regulator
MPVTIKDIAQHTGLSISTVSVALNGKGKQFRISEDTIKRVKDAQFALNYEPNMLASSLRKGCTNTIGFVAPDVSNSIFIKLAEIVEREAAKFGYSVFLAGSDESDAKCKAMIQNFVNFRVDGLIIAATSGLAKMLGQLTKREIPFVLLDRYFKNLNVNSIVMDNFNSAYCAVQYLITKGGCRRVATFSPETNLLHMLDHMRGYKAALKEHKIRFDKRLTPSIPFLNADPLLIEKHVKRLIDDYDVDGFFFQTTRTAIPGLQALLLNNYKIPEQIAVISNQDTDFFKLINPPITALVQPINEMAVRCVQTLVDAINGNKKVEKIVLPALRIEERSSV